MRYPFFSVCVAVFSVLLIGVRPSFALVDVESSRNAVTTARGWSLAGDLGFRLAQGSSRYRDLSVDLSGQYWIPQWLGLALGSWDSGDQDGQRYLRRGLGHTRLQYMLVPGLGAEVFDQIELDEFRALKLRLLAGGGLRGSWRPLTSPSIYLSGGAGLFREWEYYVASSQEKNAVLYRGNVYIHADGTFSGIEAALTGYVQPALSDWRDLRIVGEAQLRFTLRSWLTLKNGFHLSWDREPPPGIPELDLEFKTSMGILFVSP